MVAKISCALAEISSVVAKISLYCNSPTQIFPTKTTPLVALILFRSTLTQKSNKTNYAVIIFFISVFFFQFFI